MANKTERGIGKTEIETILSKKDIQQKILNSFNEFLRKQDNLKEMGLIFKKKVTKFSKSSAAIYLPKRLIGRTFMVELTPLDEPYEVSEPEIIELGNENHVTTKEEIKVVLKDKKIDVNETKPNFAPIL